MGEAMLRRLLLAAALIAGLAACATTEGYEKVLNSYVGSPETSLLAGWGPPDSVYQSGEDKYLTYRKSSSGYVPGTPPTYQTHCSYGVCTTVPIGGSPGYSYRNDCKTTFVVAGGKITKWRWEGNACVA